MKSIRPVGWILVVKPDSVEEMTKGGIVIPQVARERQQEQAILGTVLSVGDEAYSKFGEGSLIPKDGDRVIFAKYAGQVIKLDNDEFRILNDQDILGIIEEIDTTKEG